MRAIYGEQTKTHTVESITLNNNQLLYGVNYQGKYESRTFKSNDGGYTTFTGYVYFPFSIPLSEYNVVTVWATIKDNLSPTVSILGYNVGNLVSGVSIPLKFDTNVFSNMNTISRLDIEFSSNSAITAGITIDKIEFSQRKLFSDIPRQIKASVDNNVMLGCGIKQSTHPMLESYYIEGRLSLKGNPVSGTLMKVQVGSGQNLLVPTQPNGKYFHYTTKSIPVTLVAYSQWYNHNSMIRENVRPNKQIRETINEFVYSLDYSGFTQFLTGEVANENDYIRFVRIGGSETAKIGTVSFSPQKMLLLEYSMQSESNYDFFRVYDSSNSQQFQVSGTLAGYIAIQSGYSMTYSKDGGGDAGFDTVRFLSGKVVDKSNSIATVTGYINSGGTISSPDYENMTSDFIEVTPGAALEYCAWVSNPINPWISWCFYNSSKQLIGSRTAVTAFKGKIVVPTNAAFIRIGARYLKNGYLEIT